jgi:hypothetical protein
MQAIDTFYNNHFFRSRLEARWAVYFDSLQEKWEYEPEGFLLENGVKYLPDFYIPSLDSYVEVKPSINLEQDDMYGILDLYKDDFKNKWKPFSKNKKLLLAVGLPHARQMWLLFNDESFDNDGITKVLPFAYLESERYGDYWYAGGSEDYSDNQPFKQAIKKAKSARFNAVNS